MAGMVVVNGMVAAMVVTHFSCHGVSASMSGWLRLHHRPSIVKCLTALVFSIVADV